jgi:hypothetical protein
MAFMKASDEFAFVKSFSDKFVEDHGWATVKAYNLKVRL